MFMELFRIGVSLYEKNLKGIPLGYRCYSCCLRQLGSYQTGWRAALTLKELYKMGFRKDTDKPWDVHADAPLLRALKYRDHTGKVKDIVS